MMQFDLELNDKPLVVHWKRADYDVYIGRPSEWGNPYSHKDGTLAQYKVATVEEAIACFERDVLADPAMVARIKRELRGKVLGCWCKKPDRPNAPCHGDVLARIANGGGGG